MAQTVQNWFWLRGLVREAAHWGELPREFERRNPGTKVHCLDLPGNGALFKTASPISIAANADFLTSAVDKILSSQRAEGFALNRPRVLSISLGSMVAIDWVSRHPENFSGLVLINTSVRGVNPMFSRFRPANLPQLIKIALEPQIQLREKRILELTSNRPEIFEAVSKTWAAIQEKRPVSVSNAARQFIAAGTFAPKKTIRMPELLILQSRADRLLDPTCAEALHQMWGGELRYHPTAGHDLPLDDGNWMLEQIEAFQKKLKA